MPKLKSVNLELGWADHHPKLILLTPGLVERLRGLPKQCDLSLSFDTYHIGDRFRGLNDIVIALARSVAGEWLCVCLGMLVCVFVNGSVCVFVCVTFLPSVRVYLGRLSEVKRERESKEEE